jgi:DNA polymerase-4
MDLLRCYSPLIEQNSIDEAWLDMTGGESLFGPPREAAQSIMEAIGSQLGLACSIGISENKFLAKMASDMKKPQGITELWREDVPRLLWPLPAAAMIGIGRKTAEKLAHIGLKTIGDLARADEAFLVDLLGKFGREISWHARGVDLDPVDPHEDAVAKSIGRSMTLPADVSDLAEARRILLALAEDVAHSARLHGQKGRTVQVTLKYADFSVINRQMSVAATCTTQDIFLAAAKLAAENWQPERPVRLIGVSLSGFAADSSQISLFDSQDEVLPDQRLARVDQAMDLIRDKLGPDSVMRASLLNKKKRKQR